MAPDRLHESGLPPGVEGTILTVGTFDGVHLGHLDVLAKLAARARESGLRSVLVTFDPHPLEVVNPAAAPPLLTTWEEKLEVLAETGIDYAAVLPFTPVLQRYTPEQFVEAILLARFRMRELLIGYDHGFGRGRAGDVEMLQAFGARRGFRVDVVAPVSLGDGRPISSTSIRRAIAGGDLQRAAQGLGRPFSIAGVVERGSSRGRVLGFPTLNLAPPPARKLLPPEGVYAVRALTPRGRFDGMMNLGPRPTFGEAGMAVEAHLFDADADFYNMHVRLELIARLRETRRFPDADALIEQLRHDAAAARRALTLTANSGSLRSSAHPFTSLP